MTGNKKFIFWKDNLIRFRIGLSSTIESNQHRYGLIHLIYIDHRHVNNLYDYLKSSCFIFVRQGQEPDYILTPGKAYGNVKNASVIHTAPDIEFSPYELLDPTFREGGPDITDHALITDHVKPVMARYPSYTPYLFQWGGDRMIHPSNPGGGINGYTGWDTETLTGYNPSEFKEYCPDGYITPPNQVDGVDICFGIRCSLPVSSYGNASFGNCADGHFDRYTQYDAVDNLLSNYAPYTNMDFEKTIGMTLFNPETMASLFFNTQYLVRYPFSGAYDKPGSIWNDRRVGWDYRWTRDVNPLSASAVALALTIGGIANPLNPHTNAGFMKAAAMPVRCVKNTLLSSGELKQFSECRIEI